jgi:PAS domain S-box-containing protein
MEHVVKQRVWDVLARWNPPRPRTGSTENLVDYGIALGCVLGAVIARSVLAAILPESPQLLVALPAVVAASTLAGARPAIAAAITSGLAFELIFDRRAFLAWPLAGPEHLHFAVYIIASLSVIWATARLKGSLAAASMAEARLREVVRQVPAAVSILEAPHGRLIMSSHQSDAVIGHGDEDFDAIGRLADYHGFHPDGSKYTAEEYPISRALLTGAVVSGEAIRYIRPDGRQIELDVHAGPVRGANGEIIASVGMAFDVTARVEAERRLQQSELLHRELSERLNAALAAGELGTWRTDLATRRVTWDGAMAAMLGLEPIAQEMDASQSESVFEPADLELARDGFERAVREGGRYSAELRGRSATGELRWFVVRGSVLTDANKAVGVIQDVTERKARENDLRAVADARALLMREADHRIKNSLQLVVALLSLQIGRITDDEAREALKAAMGRINAVADGHLALQFSADFTVVDVAAMIEGLCARLATLNPAAKIAWAPSTPVLFDAKVAISLELILSEIITNALRHAYKPGAEGVITVDMRQTDDDILVRIADDGVGLPPKGGRQGLGTTIMQSLAAQIGAVLSTDSEPGAGTTITVSLPIP